MARADTIRPPQAYLLYHRAMTYPKPPVFQEAPALIAATPTRAKPHPKRRAFFMARAGLSAILSAALIASPALTFAQSNIFLPDLGDVSQEIMTPTQERKMGNTIVTEMRAEGVYMDDPEVNDYLDNLGHRLIAADKNTRQSFEFFAIPDSSVNAFALPGGFVGVNMGLILLTQTESELAAVLSHEISHITQHHLARTMQGQKDMLPLILGALAVAVAAAATNNGQAAQAAVAAGAAAGAQQTLNYTRDHEYEADRVGFLRLERAGFDPQGQAALMDRMLRANHSVEGITPSYLRTHPLFTERIAEARARAERASYRQVSDSLDFHFVRALLQSYQGSAREAVAFFSHQLNERKFNNELATHYGLAAALFREKNYAQAKKELTWISERVSHPMVEALMARVMMEMGEIPEALARLETALKKYPNKKQLVYDYPECLMRAKKNADAAAYLERAITRFPNDGRLHEIAARAYSALNRPFKAHQHLGEYRLWMGNVKAADDQFSLALKEKDGTFQEQSIVESRLKEIREEAPLKK